MILLLKIFSNTGASEHNSSLQVSPSDEKTNSAKSFDQIDELRLHIEEEKGRSFLASSKRTEILYLIDIICDNKESTTLLLKEYFKRYNHNLIEDLKGMSSSYGNIQENVSKFIEYGLVDTNFPHSIIV